MIDILDRNSSKNITQQTAQDVYRCYL